MRKTVYMWVVVMVALAGCQKTPYTNRNQLVIYSHAKEMSMGEEASKEILKKEKLSTNKKMITLVNRVGARLAKVANTNYGWEFNVIQDDVLNAFCLPGGKVFVYEGIFRVAKNESQLATVMSHEIAHALASHGAERMSMGQITNIGKVIIGSIAKISDKDSFNMAFGLGAQYGVMLPFSRSYEYEADEIGIYLMQKAGYDVTEAVKFWKNMKAQKSGKAPIEFLSTHPADDNRISNIKKIIDKLKKNN